MDFRVAVVLGQEFPVQGDRLVVPAGTGGAHGPVEPGLGLQAVDPEPVAEGIGDRDGDLAVARQFGAGAGGVAGRPQGHAEVMVHDAAFRLGAEDFLEGGDGLFGAAAVHRDPAEAEARRGALGANLERPPVGRRGGVEIARVEVEVAVADQRRRVAGAQSEGGSRREPRALDVAGGVVEQQLVVRPLEVVRRQ